MKKYSLYLLVCCTVFVLLITQTAIAAEKHKFIIKNTEPENLELIDQVNSNAFIDVSDNNVRLPRGNPGVISFLGEESFDLVVLTKNGIEKISPTGESKVLIEIDRLINPLAVFAGGHYPDIIVTEDDHMNPNLSQITHFSHIGNDNYIENPFLTIQGVAKSITAITRNLDKVSLTDIGEVIYHHWLGEEYYNNNVSKFSNPIDIALLEDGYNALVVDDTGIKLITNLTTVKDILIGDFTAIAANDSDGFAAIQGTEAVYYHIIDDKVYANEWRSVKAGLVTPTAIALRPGSYDMALVDGDIIKFYFWSGEELILAGEVPFDVLDGAGKYISQARLISNVLEMKNNVGEKLSITHVKIKHGGIDSFPAPGSPHTWVEWYVSTNSDLLRSDINKKDLTDLSKWKRINTSNEWYALDEPTENIRWMAVLKTKDRDYTPRIHEYIEIEFRVELKPPEIILPSGCYYTSNPEIWWNFNDSGLDGVKQSAFQVVVYKNNTEEILNTGKVISSQESYIIRNTNNFPSLWGEQTSKFQVQVKVWDDAGNESPFSTKEEFCVIAFDRPVITEVVSPPMKGREWINRFTKSIGLPVAKAGTAITMRIHGIGVEQLTKADIYYPGDRSLDKKTWEIRRDLPVNDIRPRVDYLENFKLVEGYENAVNKVWEATFYTSPDTDACPSGTVIAGKFYAKNFSTDSPLLILDECYEYKDRETPFNNSAWTSWEGYRWWAEGIAIINDTVFSDWIVVLKAKDKN